MKHVIFLVGCAFAVEKHEHPSGFHLRRKAHPQSSILHSTPPKNHHKPEEKNHKNPSPAPPSPPPPIIPSSDKSRPAPSHSIPPAKTEVHHHEAGSILDTTSTSHIKQHKHHTVHHALSKDKVAPTHSKTKVQHHEAGSILDTTAIHSTKHHKDYKKNLHHSISKEKVTSALDTHPSSKHGTHQDEIKHLSTHGVTPKKIKVHHDSKAASILHTTSTKKDKKQGPLHQFKAAKATLEDTVKNIDQFRKEAGTTKLDSGDKEFKVQYMEIVEKSTNDTLKQLRGAKTKGPEQKSEQKKLISEFEALLGKFQASLGFRKLEYLNDLSAVMKYDLNKNVFRFEPTPTLEQADESRARVEATAEDWSKMQKLAKRYFKLRDSMLDKKAPSEEDVLQFNKLANDIKKEIDPLFYAVEEEHLGYLTDLSAAMEYDLNKGVFRSELTPTLEQQAAERLARVKASAEDWSPMQQFTTRYFKLRDSILKKEGLSEDEIPELIRLANDIKKEIDPLYYAVHESLPFYMHYPGDFDAKATPVLGALIDMKLNLVGELMKLTSQIAPVKEKAELMMKNYDTCEALLSKAKKSRLKIMSRNYQFANLKLKINKMTDELNEHKKKVQNMQEGKEEAAANHAPQTIKTESVAPAKPTMTSQLKKLAFGQKTKDKTASVLHTSTPADHTTHHQKHGGHLSSKTSAHHSDKTASILHTTTPTSHSDHTNHHKHATKTHKTPEAAVLDIHPSSVHKQPKHEHEHSTHNQKKGVSVLATHNTPWRKVKEQIITKHPYENKKSHAAHHTEHHQHTKKDSQKLKFFVDLAEIPTALHKKVIEIYHGHDVPEAIRIEGWRAMRYLLLEHGDRESFSEEVKRILHEEDPGQARIDREEWEKYAKINLDGECENKVVMKQLNDQFQALHTKLLQSMTGDSHTTEANGVPITFHREHETVKDVYAAIGLKLLWYTLQKHGDVPIHLDTMPEVNQLWKVLIPKNLIILTGAPDKESQAAAEHQKCAWCEKHLDHDVPVICCNSNEKQTLLADGVAKGLPAAMHVLISDEKAACDAWESKGGKAIFHDRKSKSVDHIIQQIYAVLGKHKSSTQGHKLAANSAGDSAQIRHSDGDVNHLLTDDLSSGHHLSHPHPHTFSNPSAVSGGSSSHSHSHVAKDAHKKHQSGMTKTPAHGFNNYNFSKDSDSTINMAVPSSPTHSKASQLQWKPITNVMPAGYYQHAYAPTNIILPTNSYVPNPISQGETVQLLLPEDKLARNAEAEERRRQQDENNQIAAVFSRGIQNGQVPAYEDPLEKIYKQTHYPDGTYHDPFTQRPPQPQPAIIPDVAEQQAVKARKEAQEAAAKKAREEREEREQRVKQELEKQREKEKVAAEKKEEERQKLRREKEENLKRENEKAARKKAKEARSKKSKEARKLADAKHAKEQEQAAKEAERLEEERAAAQRENEERRRNEEAEAKKERKQARAKAREEEEERKRQLEEDKEKERAAAAAAAAEEAADKEAARLREEREAKKKEEDQAREEEEQEAHARNRGHQESLEKDEDSEEIEQTGSEPAPHGPTLTRSQEEASEELKLATEWPAGLPTDGEGDPQWVTDV